MTDDHSSNYTITHSLSVTFPLCNNFLCIKQETTLPTNEPYTFRGRTGQAKAERVTDNTEKLETLKEVLINISKTNKAIKRPNNGVCIKTLSVLQSVQYSLSKEKKSRETSQSFDWPAAI